MTTVRIIIVRKKNNNDSMFLYTIQKRERPSKYVCIKTEYIQDLNQVFGKWTIFGIYVNTDTI